MRTLYLTLALSLTSCILPDLGIVVYAKQGCGEQFLATTNFAWGYTGSGELKTILIDDQPLLQKWCLTPEEAYLMSYEDSWIYIQVREDIIDACIDRAIELELGMVNCEQMATIAYSGQCPGESEWCEANAESESESESGTNDEVGTPN